MVLRECSDLKSKIRVDLKNRRHKFFLSDKAKDHRLDIGNFLEALIPSSSEFSEFKVASYFSMQSEADPNYIFSLSNKYRSFFPKIENENLSFYELPKSLSLVELEEKFLIEKNVYNIWEPVKKIENLIHRADIDYILVPGLAFDRYGGRLGMGKGYYDRVLGQLSAKKIGIASSVQILDEKLPMEEHDVIMDYVVTEKYIIQPVRNVS